MPKTHPNKPMRWSRLLTITGPSEKQSRSSGSARELSSSARTRRYPVSDAPPLERGPIPPADRNTGRVRAFAAAVNDLVHDHLGRHPG